MADNKMHHAPSTAGTSTERAQVALFTPIFAPILYFIDPIQVARFFRERGRYELEVESNQAEVASLHTVPYTASIDRSLLKHLVFMRNFDDIDPKATMELQTSEPIKYYLLCLVQSVNQSHDQRVYGRLWTG